MASGSEVLIRVYRTPFWSRILALVIFSSAIVLCLFNTEKKNKFRIGIIFGFALVIFMMSLHSLVYSGRKAAYMDAWAIFYFQKVEFNKAEGPHCLSCKNYVIYEKTFFWLYLENKIGQKAYIFLGIPPWRIDAKALEALDWMESDQ